MELQYYIILAVVTHISKKGVAEMNELNRARIKRVCVGYEDCGAPLAGFSD